MREKVRANNIFRWAGKILQELRRIQCAVGTNRDREGRMITVRDMLGRIGAAERVFWFIDFDGTLVPIVRRPELVDLEAGRRAALSLLAAREATRVTVISGRPLADVRRLIDLPTVTCAGNHGLEIAGAGISFRHPGGASARASLEEVKRGWVEEAARYRGSLVEDKGMSITFHYRQVGASLQEEARRAAEAEAEKFAAAGKIRITSGKKVVEVRPPVAWGKGDALRHLLRHWRYGRERDLVVALGDDETDRDMFGPAGEEGLAIFVGRGEAPPEATARLPGSAAVARFIEKAARQEAQV
jgi:trehalose-phosphatase